MQSISGPLSISVIIATKDRFKDLFNCLHSLNNQTQLPKEIIIVDSSVDEAIKYELEKGNGFKVPVIYIHSEAGLTLQRNIGVKAATGELLAFFDDDIVLDISFFENIASVFLNENQGKVGGATGRITNEIFPRWSLQNVFRFLTFFSYPSYGEIRVSGFHTGYNWFAKPLKVEWLWGGLTVYRKEVFDSFSFDENLKGYGYNEDLDFSYRVSRKYECWYIPSAKAEHHKNVSRLSPALARVLIVNNHYLLQKNILPGKSLAMQLLHVATFYIAIFSFLFFLLIEGRFDIFKGGVIGLGNVWFKRSSFLLIS